MEITDIQRIGVGSDKFPSIRESKITPPKFYFSFDSEEVTFDSTENTFDQL